MHSMKSVTSLADNRLAESRIAALPLWKGDISIALLKGGISNESYVVEDDTGKYVVRFGTDYPFHHVFRARVAMTAQTAHRAAVAQRDLARASLAQADAPARRAREVEGDTTL